MVRQLALPLKTWGGRREGAGRKPKGDKAGVSHLRRPRVTRHSPVHVTLRLNAKLPNLRRGEYPATVTAALRAGRKSEGFRLVHYSIQSNHLHLIVEAADNETLARGMKALNVRVARAVNRLREAKGRVFADRYHSHVLGSPREVRHALVYVLNNFRKHGAARPRERFDACSSAAAFDGFVGGGGTIAAGASEPAVVAPRSWLLTSGWRRHRLVDPLEVPRVCAGPKPAARKPKVAADLSS